MEEEKRIWNLRLNLDDFNSEYLKLRSDGDRFSFFLGFHCGCMNGPSDESDPKPFICGFAIGSAMYQKALALSQANSGRAMVSVESRRGKYGTAQPGRQPTERSSSERSSERRTDAQALSEPNELTNQRTNDEANNQERKTNKESPLYPPKGKIVQTKFSANAFDALIPSDLATHSKFPEAWREWILDRHARRKPVTERAAKQQLASLQAMGGDDAVQSICQSIANGWQGLFAPKATRLAGSPISPPAPRQEAKRLTWAIERDIRDEEKRLAAAQSERREARDQRNRFSQGQAEYSRYNAEMRKADDVIAASEARLVELRNELEASK